jgi:protein MpaA
LLALTWWLLVGGTALAQPPLAARPSTAVPTPTATSSPAVTPSSIRPTPTLTLLPPTSTSTPTPTATATSAPTLTPTPIAADGIVGSQVIGYSSQGRPLTVYQVGAGSRGVLIVGGIDGGTESNTTALVDQLLDRLPDAPDLLHAGFVLLFLPAANPDGLVAGTRWLADGVDANRNWPTDDWSPDTYVSGPVLIRGGGGAYPFSEPETRALAAFVQRIQPNLIVSYHSAAELVMAGPAARALGLDRLYADVTGYAPGDWSAYPVTGDFAQWAEKQGIPTVEIELPDHTTTDFEANFSAFRALIGQMRTLVYPAAQRAGGSL